MTKRPAPSRYEGVLVHARGNWDWDDWVSPIRAACAAGMTVGVAASSPDELPAPLQEGLDLGIGTLLVASYSSPRCRILDRRGVWTGRRDLGDGEDADGEYGDGSPLAWITRHMWDRGVGPSDTLTLDHPRQVTALVAQAKVRRRPALPEVRPEPGWELVSAPFDVDRLRVNSALFGLSSGVVGASGGTLARYPGSARWVLVGGTYVGDGPDTHLLSAPIAFQLPYDMAESSDLRRTLDLRTGLLREELTTTAGPLTSVRFVSLARPGAMALRARCPGRRPPSPHIAPLLEPGDDRVVDAGSSGSAVWMRTAGSPGGAVAAATDSWSGNVLDRVAAYERDAEHVPEPGGSLGQLDAACADGFDSLLVEHREAWAERWAEADVAIEGDRELQRAVRFSLFHLMAAVPDHGEAAVGARGLTGSGYRGHVFWDADTFVLPFLAATHPTAARAMLEYRLRRLPAAMTSATQLGYRGARFPWESAHSGRDVTPTSARDRTGRVVPIRTGALEEHIVSQVAWAACCYTDWTGDEDFAAGPGLELLVETARYWASRVRMDAGGAAHFYGVIGPDEYHEPVDDNAFTNVMARWNLRRAARAVASVQGSVVEPEETSRWLEIADSLVDGYDADTGVYEQFSGFFGLEPLIISEVAPRRPIAADLLLGADRVNGAQVLKQPDVLMLYHLVPDEVEAEAFEPNLRFYEPRTAHGSSLSPAIHASLFARARNYEAALDLLRIASRIDLDDLTGSTAAGLHLATMGGLWQAFAFGFVGLRPRDGRLSLDPRLPHEWASLDLTVRFHGARVEVHVEHYDLIVTAELPTAITVQGERYDVDSRGLSFTRRGKRWEMT